MLGLRLLRGDSANGPTAPSNSWAKGSHRTWKMDIDKRSMFIGDKDHLIVADMDSDYKITTVTAYDVSGDKPKEQWSADPRTDSFYLFYWGDYVVAGDMLIKADTGKTTDAPWTERPTSGIVLPSTAKEKPQIAEVIAVSDSVKEGKENKNIIKGVADPCGG